MWPASFPKAPIAKTERHQARILNILREGDIMLKKSKFMGTFCNFKENWPKRAHCKGTFFKFREKCTKGANYEDTLFANSHRINQARHTVRAFLQHLEGTYT